ncbi:hypothetical protein F8279_03885 [Micromonospora sp. AMSO1212t]|nr:hypothetical protein F8279_03885 [Micromonospora sp. AMSO1212t]
MTKNATKLPLYFICSHAEDPSLLGLGDLVLMQAERRQPRAGRLAARSGPRRHRRQLRASATTAQSRGVGDPAAAQRRHQCPVGCFRPRRLVGRGAVEPTQDERQLSPHRRAPEAATGPDPASGRNSSARQRLTSRTSAAFFGWPGAAAGRTGFAG